MKKMAVIDNRSVEFPERLRNIPDPPKQLYCLGDLSLLHEKSAAVVGARKFTVYGKNVALMIGRRLAESCIPVVSGFALGIDAFSHEGALGAGGKTIGVLGFGMDMMRYQHNYGLMQKSLEKGGLIVTEYPPDMHASRITFPKRNRIISGMAEVLVVVEAGLNSGSLITAKCAADQGRTVYAVPGNINSSTSIGTNLLIRDGAIPMVIIDDLIRDIGAEAVKAKTCSLNLDDDEEKIFESVRSRSGATSEEIISDTGMSASLVSSLITVMEIKGIVESYAGRIYPGRC